MNSCAPRATRRAYIETYGCQMNIADGELMRGILASDGYEIVDRPDQADVILVNTCAIRENVERRVLGRVGELKGLKRYHPDLLIGVTGCMAQRMGDALLKKLPYVDLVMGPDGYRSLPDQLRTLRNGQPETKDVRERPRHTRRVQLAVLEMDDTEHYEGLELRRRSDVTAWIPIQRGCDHRCTFCIVPDVRGPEKNRAPRDILAEASELARTGVTEVTLLGQTVNSYHRDGSRGVDTDFSDLLEAVAEIDGVERIRFMSPHPYYMTDRVIDAMASIPAVCEGLHLPVQSGSTPVLKSMLRNYTREYYLELLGKLRSKMPDIAISTDLIVGFPGEGEDDFAQTLSLIDEARFDRGFVFKYSPRAGTPAASMDSHPEELVEARHLECLDRVEAIGREQRDSRVGSFQEVLIEEPNFGRTRGNQKMQVEGAHRVGETVRVQVARIERGTLQGVPVGRETPVSL